MNTNNPLVSVIIPTYNALLYLKDMIQCVVDQIYNEWELIIVDDNSTDGTFDFVTKLASADKRIKIYLRDRSPKGAQTCRNIGLKHCVGVYVVFFDADDLISPDCLHRRVKFMLENNTIDFAIFAAMTFQTGCFSYKEVSKFNNYQGTLGIRRLEDPIKSLLEADYQFTVWTNIYKKESIGKIVWDENLTVLQDFDFLFATLDTGLSYLFYESKKPDYFYRQHLNGSNISSTFSSPEKCLSTFYLFEKTFSLLRKRSDAKLRVSQFYKFYILHLSRLLLESPSSESSKFVKLAKSQYSLLSYFGLVLLSEILNNIPKNNIKKVCIYFICAVFYQSNFHLKQLNTYVNLKIKSIL